MKVEVELAVLQRVAPRAAAQPIGRGGQVDGSTVVVAMGISPFGLEMPSVSDGEYRPRRAPWFETF